MTDSADLTSQLNAKQEMFCREYIVDLNATQAAIRAGYSEKTAQEQGSQLLSKLIIKQRVQSLMNDRTERLQIDADYVLSTIVETVERCRQSISPMVYKNGDPIYTETEDGDEARAFNFDSSAVLKGAELLGKHLKLFTEKTELTATVSFESLSDEALNARITELMTIRER